MPDQPPLAVHKVAFIEDQPSVAEEPVEIEPGFAVSVTVGGAVAGDDVTLTVLNCVAGPPFPVQLRVYVVVVVGSIDSLPLVAFVPDQPPLAAQEVAFVDDQLITADAP